MFLHKSERTDTIKTQALIVDGERHTLRRQSSYEVVQSSPIRDLLRGHFHNLEGLNQIKNAWIRGSARKNEKPTALLVIDAEEGWTSDKNKYGCPGLNIIADDVISGISRLVKVYRAEKLPVIFIRFEGSKIHPKLKPKHGEHVIDKDGYSAFSNPRLLKTLENLRVKDVVVCGFETSCCVFLTVIEGAMRYHVKVVSDCCFPQFSNPTDIEKFIGYRPIDKRDIRDAVNIMRLNERVELIELRNLFRDENPAIS